MPAFGRPDQADVGEQLEAQLDLTRLALEAALREPRRLPRGGGEALVAVTARAAARDHDPLAVGEQLGLRAVEAQDDRPGRHRNDAVRPALPVLALALAVLPAPGAEVPAPPERGEVAALGVADQHDVAAAPAVAAVGTAARHVRLAPKADHAVAAAAALHIDLGSIEKHGAKVAGWSCPEAASRSRRRAAPARTSAAASALRPPRPPPASRGPGRAGFGQTPRMA